MYRKILSSELRVHKAKGYIYFTDIDHPLAYLPSGFVYYHRLQASLKLGRWILSSEEVHHKNKDKSDNSFDNLEVLTKSEHLKKHSTIIVEKQCIYCGKEFLPKQNKIRFCSVNCADSQKVKDKELTKDILEPLIWSVPYSKLGPKLGYSDNGIKKRAMKLGCLMPPPLFHSKFLKQEDKLTEYNKKRSQSI